MKQLVLALCILVAVSSNAQSVEGQFPQATQKPLQVSDIAGMDLASLRLMRNEIFARYGYIFKSEDLKKHFESQPWYKASKTDVTSMLSEVEKANIKIIKEQEERINKTADFDSFYEVFSKAVQSDDMETLAKLLSFEFYKSVDEFKNSYEIHAGEIRSAVNEGASEKYPGCKVLRFGEYYNGVQYSWVEFQKIGCCWFIYAIGRAG